MLAGKKYVKFQKKLKGCRFRLVNWHFWGQSRGQIVLLSQEISPVMTLIHIFGS